MPRPRYYWQTVFGGFRKNESSDLSPSLYTGCTAHGKYSVTIHLRTPSGPFLSAQVISSFAIQSPTALKKYGANKGELRNGTFYPSGSYAFSHPTGTGPFKFGSWTVGQRVVLNKFNGYWGKKARINTLIIRPISDNTARLQALQTGDVQGYDLVAPEHIGTIKANSKLKVLNRPSFNVAYVTIHQGPGSPMNDIKVRQAVAYGLDRASVVRSFYAGRGKVAKEFQPPTALRLQQVRHEVPVQPDEGEGAAQLVELPRPLQGGLLVPDERLAAVHAGSEAELRGVLGQPQAGRASRSRRIARRGGPTTSSTSTTERRAT